MKTKNRKNILFIFTILGIFIYGNAAVAAINIVATENVYGEVAKELGGANVNVLSILNSPAQDPHLFSINPDTAKAITQADIVIYNGANYDSWIEPMLAMKNKKTKQIIVIAQLMQIKPGSNPHLWYLPETMPTFAQNLVMLLKQDDPQHQHYYEQQLNHFNQTYQTIFTTLKQLKQQFQNVPVIATEPIFNYMAQSIGLQMHGEDFQVNIMNDIPPTISQIKSFEDDLHQHKVKVLIYNNQVVNPMTKRMLSMAQKEGIRVVGVSEMMPSNTTYVQWILMQLKNLEQALK